MAVDPYDWANGAILDEHSKRKHDILRGYIYDYVTIRCTNMPAQKHFKLAFIDGFCGGGRYQGGYSGSPVIFLEQLKSAYEAVTIERKNQNLDPISFECFLLCNDTNRDAIEQLKFNIAPIEEHIKEICPYLKIKVAYICENFEKKYSDIKRLLLAEKFHNVLFYLDPCGYTDISRDIIIDIIRNFERPEIFYTFMLGAFLQYKDKSNIEELKGNLMQFGIPISRLNVLDKVAGEKESIGAVEKILWTFFYDCADYVSVFPINYQHGYRRYWLMHFARHDRARSAYNNVLHKNDKLSSAYRRHRVTGL